jgi:hypothetical protein
LVLKQAWQNNLESININVHVRAAMAKEHRIAFSAGIFKLNHNLRNFVGICGEVIKRDERVRFDSLKGLSLPYTL